MEKRRGELPEGVRLEPALFDRRIRAARRIRKKGRDKRPRLTIKRILAWVDDHYTRTGKWPTRNSGDVLCQYGEQWQNIDNALRVGLRSLRPGSSLPRLLAEDRGVRNRQALPRYTVGQMLLWAERHFQRTGTWPKETSGPILDAPGETWRAVQSALYTGKRGLPGGSTLARFLSQHFGVRNHMAVPRLNVQTILRWADDHHQRTGRWPTQLSGAVAAVPGERWNAVSLAMHRGTRGLSGGTSLAQLLERERGLRHLQHLRRLNVKQILGWADAHHRRTGSWPRSHSGRIWGWAHDEWRHINIALRTGSRGLPGGDSLAGLLARERGVRSATHLARLSITKILRWADVHRKKTGHWPRLDSGAIPESPGDTWFSISKALRAGRRGVREGTSLRKLLVQHGRPAVGLVGRRLTEAMIVRWADLHHRRTGRWPSMDSGPVIDAPDEHWGSLNSALLGGRRGLRGGDSVAKLLARYGRKPNMGLRPKLSEGQIVEWARRHQRRTGKWPTGRDGAVIGQPGETWQNIAGVVRRGQRGLPGGDTLHRMLKRQSERD